MNLATNEIKVGPAPARKRSYVRSTVIGYLAVLLGLLAAPSAEAATFTVGSAGDGGDKQPGDGVCDTTVQAGVICTLRAAIQEANAFRGDDTIRFQIGGSSVVKTISPAKGLPAIRKPVIINGYTQPGASANTQSTGDNARPLVQLNGSRLTTASHGLNGFTVTGGQSLIQGLVINDFNIGIELLDRGGNRLRGNFIGTDPSGTAGEGNGINIGLYQSSSNLIGGTAPAARNIIADSTRIGISLFDSAANRVVGNYIGTARDGIADLGNGGDLAFDNDNDAIRMGGMPAGNRIGGTTAAAANVIAFSGGDGVSVAGDFCTDPFSGDLCTGNAILGNSIHHNGDMGIDIGREGVTENDLGDPDAGDNLLQNHPVITDAERAGFSDTAIEGGLNSAPSTTFTVQFFSNPADEEVDEGQRFLGQTRVTTNGAGNAFFDVTFNTGNLTGAFVTATATDPAGNTSEFSPGRVVERPPIDGGSS